MSEIFKVATFITGQEYPELEDKKFQGGTQGTPGTLGFTGSLPSAAINLCFLNSATVLFVHSSCGLTRPKCSSGQVPKGTGVNFGSHHMVLTVQAHRMPEL